MNIDVLPAETKLYYSKPKNFPLAVIGLLAAGIGGYMFIVNPHDEMYRMFSYLIGVSGGVFAFFSVYRLYSSKPQIIISDNGIEITSWPHAVPFYSWSKISNERYIETGNGRFYQEFLAYDYPGGHVKKPLSYIETKSPELESLLVAYRTRYEQQKDNNKSGL